MMMSDDKVGGWVKKGQNHDDVILECPLVTYLFSGTTKGEIVMRWTKTAKRSDRDLLRIKMIVQNLCC